MQTSKSTKKHKKPCGPCPLNNNSKQSLLSKGLHCVGCVLCRRMISVVNYLYDVCVQCYLDIQ